MTRREFELLAAAIRDLDLPQPHLRPHLAEAIANVCEVGNERFDRVRFLDACIPGPAVRTRLSADEREAARTDWPMPAPRLSAMCVCGVDFGSHNGCLCPDNCGRWTP